MVHHILPESDHAMLVFHNAVCVPRRPGWFIFYLNGWWWTAVKQWFEMVGAMGSVDPRRIGFLPSLDGYGGDY